MNDMKKKRSLLLILIGFIEIVLGLYIIGMICFWINTAYAIRYIGIVFFS